MKHIPILNIDQFKLERISGFYCNNLALHLEKNKSIVNTSHRHDFFLCVVFTDGEGVHEIDFESHVVQPGSVFFLRPGQTHRWEFNKRPDGYIFFHTQEFYEISFNNHELEQFPFYYSHTNPPYLHLTSNELNSIRPRFDEIFTEYQHENYYQKQKLASLVNLVYIDLSRKYSKYDQVKKVVSPNYLETLAYLDLAIEKNYKIEKSAHFYADRLNITARHLNRIVKTTLNKTTTQLINERLILEAKRLIVHSTNTFSEISEILGFEDYAYFSRVFKQRSGYTPLNFKKRFKN
ncbi:AraC family transcriptional regulator [Maribacter sp. X9]|uniref:AraC family transcriptional regulator n=1 Tax=Maribacter sp. X9 TaxID=3402159 RepID=UPI003AF37F01